MFRVASHLRQYLDDRSVWSMSTLLEARTDHKLVSNVSRLPKIFSFMLLYRCLLEKLLLISNYLPNSVRGVAGSTMREMSSHCGIIFGTLVQQIELWSVLEHCCVDSFHVWTYDYLVTHRLGRMPRKNCTNCSFTREIRPGDGIQYTSKGNTVVFLKIFNFFFCG